MYVYVQVHMCRARRASRKNTEVLVKTRLQWEKAEVLPQNSHGHWYYARIGRRARELRVGHLEPQIESTSATYRVEHYLHVGSATQIDVAERI